MRHADLIPSLTAWVRDDGPVSTWTSRAPGLIRAVVVVVVVAALPLLILTSCPANRDGMPGGLAAAMQETAAAVRSGALALQLWTQDRSTRQLVNVQLTDARDEVTKAYQGIAELRGFDIDVTPSGAAQQAAITEAVAEIAVNRACFEQVKGILMLVYRIDADVAFDLLKWRSQETNVKLRVLGIRRKPAAPFNVRPRIPHNAPTRQSQRQLATDLNPQCGGVVQRPAWTPRNLAGARKLTTPLSLRPR